MPLTMLLTGRGTSATNYIAGVFGSVTSSVAPSSIQSPSIVNAQNITLSSSSSSLIQGGVIGYIDGLNGFSFSSGATLENRGFLSTTAGLGVTGGVIGSINNITSSASLNSVIFSQNCNSTGNCVSRTNGIVSTTAGAAFMGVVNNANLSLTTFTFPTNARTSFTYGEGNSGGLIGLFGGSNARLPTSTLPNTIFITLASSNNVYSYVGGLIGNVTGGTIDNTFNLSYFGNISIGAASGEGPSSSTTTGGIIGRLSNQDGTLDFNPASLSVTPSAARSISAGLGGSRGSIYNYVGGIIGFVDGTFNTALSPLNITSAMTTNSNLTVSGGSTNNITVTGGLIGRMTGYATLSGSNSMTNASNLSGSFVGGIVGSLSTLNTNPLTNSTFSTSALASLSSSNALAAGSVVGVIHNMTYDNTNIARPLNNVTVPTGASGAFGGFAGEITGSTINANIANPSNYTVLGAGTSAFIGGLMGSVDGGSIIQGTLTNIARVSGGNYVGGLVGRLGGPNLFGSNSSAITGGTILGAMSYGDGLPSAGLNSITGTASGTGFGGLIGGMYGASGSQSTLSGPMTLNIGVFDPLNPTFVFNAFTPTAVGGAIGYANGNVNITSSMSFNPNFPGSPATLYAPTANAVGSWIGQASSAIFAGTTDITSSNVTVIGGNRIGGILGFIADATVVNPGAKFTATNTTTVQIVPSATVGVYAGGVVGQIGGIGVTASGNATIGGEFTHAGTVSFYTAPSAGTYYIAGVAGNIANFTTITGTDLVNTTKFINTADLTAAANVGSTVYLGGVISLYSDASASGTGIVITNSGDILGTNVVGGNIALLGGSLFNASLSGTLSNSGLIQSSLTTGTNYIGGNIGIHGGTTFAPNIINATVTNTGTVSLLNTPVSGTHYLAGVIGYVNLGTLGTGSTFTNMQAMSSTSQFVNLSGVVGLFANGSIFQSGASMFNGTSLVNGPAITNTATTNAPVSGVIGTVLSGTVAGSMTNFGLITGAGTGAAGTTGTAGIIAIMTGGTLAGTASASLINNANIVGGQYTGGLIGYFAGGVTGQNTLTSNATTVQGLSEVGGIFGATVVPTATSFFSTGGLIRNNSAVISTSGTNLGGIFGKFTSSATTAFTIAANMENNGQVGTSGSGATDTGGISGTMSGLNNTAIITFSGTLTNTGTVYGASNTGGLFGSTSNLNITGGLVLAGSSTITGGVLGSAVGGLIGFMSNATTLAPSSITLTGQTVTGLNDIGGFVGKMQGSAGNLSTFSPAGNITITNATITGTGSNVGSLVGFMSDYSQFSPTGTSGSRLNFSTNSGVNVLGAGNVGGLFGNIAVTVANSALFNPTYTNFNNAATVKVSSGAATYLGGIFGNFGLTGATIDSSNTNIFTNTGVVGDSTLTTNASSGTGGVFGNIAGLTGAGGISFGGTLINSGNVYGVSNVGGVAGSAAFTTFTGNITGKSNVRGTGNVGGLVGSLISSIMSGNLEFGDNTANTYTLTLPSGNSSLGVIAGSISGTVAGNNINLNNVTIKPNVAFSVAGATDIGGIAGFAGAGTQLGGTLSSVGTTLMINGATNVGAIIGRGFDITLGSMTNNVALSGTSNIMGGVVGLLTGTTSTSTSITGTLSNTNTIAGNTRAGGVVGQLLSLNLSTGAMSGTGNVSGNQYVGGLIGEMSGSNVSNTMNYSAGTLTVGTSDLAAITGHMTGISSLNLDNITVAATTQFNVAGKQNVAAVAGLVDGTPTFAGTLNPASVGAVITINGASNVGLIMGKLNGVANFTSNVISNANLGGTSTVVGSIAGIVSGSTVSGTWTNNGNIIGASHVGGVIGKGDLGSVFSGTFINTGNVDPADFVGGIMDEANNVTLSGNYQLNGGTVTGGNTVGGLFANITNGTIITAAAQLSTAAGAVVSGASNVAGLIATLDMLSANYQATNPFTNNAEVTTTGASTTNTIAGVFGTVTPGLTIGNNLTNAGNVHSTTATGIAGIVANPVNLTFNGTLTHSGTVSGVGNVGGLFSTLSGAASNLSAATLLSTGTVNGTGTNIGGMVAYFNNATTLNTLVTSAATVTGTGTNVGGMIGQSTVNISSNLTATGSVTGSTKVGKVIGLASGGNVSGTLTGSGAVNGAQYVGGLVGALADATLSGNLTYSGTVNASTGDAGFAVGYMSGNSNIASSNLALSGANFNSSTTAIHLGGVVGLFEGAAQLSGFSSSTWLVNTINTPNATNVSSVIGKLLNATGLNNNLATLANVIGGTNVGGVVGYATGASTNLSAGTWTHAAGKSVSGTTTVGGLVGLSDTTLGVAMTSAGAVTGTTLAGGIVGKITGSGNISGTMTLSPTMTLSGSQYLGGIAGSIENQARLSGNKVFNLVTLNTGSSSQYVGGLMGRLFNSTYNVADNLNNSMNVIGGTYVAGVVGEAISSTISNAIMSNTGNITGANYVSHIAGQLANSTLANTLSGSGTLTLNSGGTGMGGFAARMTGNSNISGTATLNNANFVTPNANTIGMVVGSLENSSALTGTFNLPSTLTIASTGTTKVGTLVGEMLNLTLNQNLSSNRRLTALTTDTAGGLVGAITNSNINGTLSTSGIVQARNDVGGVAGTIVNSTVNGHMNASGQITGVDMVGGLSGSMQNSTVNEAFFTGTVTGAQTVGGITGNLISGTLNRVYNNSKNTVIGTTNVGGIAGINNGTINNSIFGGAIQIIGTGINVGGFAGVNNGTIYNSLSGGKITGSGSNIGALAGTNNNDLGNSFYSVDTFSGLSPVGAGSPSTSHSGNYNTLGFPFTFVVEGWNFSSTWQPLTGYYVTLQWCNIACAIPNINPPTTIPVTPFGKQYVTVEQALTDDEVAGYSMYSFITLDSFAIYHVPMVGYSIPFKVAIFYRDPSEPKPTALQAARALAARGFIDRDFAQYKNIQ